MQIIRIISKDFYQFSTLVSFRYTGSILEATESQAVERILSKMLGSN